MNELKRISSLFKDESVHQSLLNELSTIGVIAGGSVVFALNNFVPSLSVSDIDLFCNSATSFIEALECIRKHCDDIKCFIFDGLNPYQLSVLTVSIPAEQVKYQLIYKEFKTPEDVINQFDIDYVQCAIHCDKLYITDECIESHLQKKVIKFHDLRFRNDRLLKAIKKGFACPILTDNLSFEFPIKSIRYNDIKKSHISSLKGNEYFETRDREITFLSINSLEIIGFNFTKEWHGSYFGKFMIDCGNERIVERSIVSVEMDVIEDLGRYVEINDGPIKNLFTTFKKKDPNMVIPLGKSIFLVEGYMINREFKAKLVAIVPGALPLKIADKLTIIGHHKSMVYTTQKPKYHKVLEEIDRLKSEKETDLNRHKINAYKCFMYHVTHDNDQNKAIQISCQQMNYDVYKRRNDPMMTFALSLSSININTINDMIEYINGFN